MKHNRIKLQPIRFGSGQKGEVRTQFGAVCYRIQRDKVQVLLVTSRNSGRWIVPKGWPVKDATPYEAVLTEAWEEAGVKGKIRGHTLGIYSYAKRGGGAVVPCMVVMFAVKVSSLASSFPERGQRRRKWFSTDRAAKLLAEPELRQLVRDFDPAAL